MQRVAVVGAGISGLSACYYLTKLNPAQNILLFEQAKPGGWIQTMEKDNFLFENGPRSIRLAPNSIHIFEIAAKVGVLDKLMVSSTRNIDAAIFADEKMTKMFPPGYFRIAKGLLTTPLYRRMVLAYLFKRKSKAEPVDDESIADFVAKNIPFWNEQDKDYLISTQLDAFQTGVYSGDVHKLSAKWCPPFSEMFKKKYEGYKSVKRLRHEDEEIEKAFMISASRRSNAFNFKGGLSVLTNAMLEYLKKFPNFTYIPKGVTTIEKSENGGKITDEGNVPYKADHIITTIPSHAVSKILKGYSKITDLCNTIPHKSLLALNVGFEEDHGLDGVGYLIPSRVKSPISGVLFDSSQFPWLKPCVSIMGPVEKNSHEYTDIFMKAFQKQTGVTQQPKTIVGSFCEKALPQYNVGHYKIVKEIEEKSPSWLHVSGQSLYRSGIPNCVITSKDVVNKIMTKSIK